MKNININGKNYRVVPMNFETVCDREEMGIALDDYSTKQMAFMRAYIALCMGADKSYASQEIEQHILNDGKLDEIVETIQKEVEESDFFRKLKEKAEETTSESKTEEKKATE